MTENTDKQAFEIARLQILSIAYNNKNILDEYYALIFAWNYRIFPYLHSADSELIKCMSSNFKYSRNDIKNVYDILEGSFTNKEHTNHSLLMNKLQFSIGSHELENICRYLFLSDTFDKDFWNSFNQKIAQEKIDIKELDGIRF